MKFEEVLSGLRSGGAYRLETWGAKSYITLQSEDDGSIMTLPFIKQIDETAGTSDVYVMRYTEIFSEDWALYSSSDS